MGKMWVLGTGESLLRYGSELSQLEKEDTIAFHRFFPHGALRFGIIPRYWTWSDPDAAMEGLLFINRLNTAQVKDLSRMEILVPSFINGSYELFREYLGTTPLERKESGWFAYKYYLEEAKRRGMVVTEIDSVTTKYLANNPDFMPQITQNIEDPSRFKQNKVVFGTVPYDSESVSGVTSKWGLENKLSSTVFPIAQNLGATELYVAGFDCVGGRFYEVAGTTKVESGTRHPWNDETQKEPVFNIPLEIIKKWDNWSEITGMKVYNVIEDKYSLLSKAVSYIKFEQALKP